MTMTPIEKLKWLQANTCLFSIEVNEHRAYYDPIERALSLDDPHGVARDMSAEDRAECIRRKEVVVVQCYPSTPIGFLRVAHYDLATAVDAVYDAVKSDEHFKPYVAER